MNESFDKHRALGMVEVGMYDPKLKLWIPCHTIQPNLVVNQSADILAKALSGDADYKITHVYFEGTNNNDAAVAPLATNTISYFHALTANRGYIRQPLGLPPGFTASSDSYANNRVQFFATTGEEEGLYQGSPVENEISFNQLSGSKIIGCGLVCSPDGDQTNDLLFARFNFATPISKVDGLQPGIKWTIEFR